MTKEKVEQPVGMKPMTAEERKENGLAPLEEKDYGVETESKS